MDRGEMEKMIGRVNALEAATGAGEAFDAFKADVIESFGTLHGQLLALSKRVSQIEALAAVDQVVIDEEASARIAEAIDDMAEVPDPPVQVLEADGGRGDWERDQRKDELGREVPEGT